jgi:hypothetical protein
MCCPVAFGASLDGFDSLNPRIQFVGESRNLMPGQSTSREEPGQFLAAAARIDFTGDGQWIRGLQMGRHHACLADHTK